MDYSHSWLYTAFVVGPTLFRLGHLNLEDYGERARRFADLVIELILMSWKPVFGIPDVHQNHGQHGFQDVFTSDFLREDFRFLLNRRPDLLDYPAIPPEIRTVETRRTPVQFIDELTQGHFMSWLGELVAKDRPEFGPHTEDQTADNQIRFGLDLQPEDGLQPEEREKEKRDRFDRIFGMAFALAWMNAKVRGALLLGHSQWMDFVPNPDETGFKTPVYRFQHLPQVRLRLTELCIDFILKRMAAREFVFQIGEVIRNFEDNLITEKEKTDQMQTYARLDNVGVVHHPPDRAV